MTYPTAGFAKSGARALLLMDATAQMKIARQKIMARMRTTQKGIRMRFFQLGPALGWAGRAMVDVMCCGVVEMVCCVRVFVYCGCDCNCGRWRGYR